MFSQVTRNYQLPQWLPDDRPTFLGDFNDAFCRIDTQMKINYDLANRAMEGGVPQSLINQVNQNTTDIGTLAGQIGTDVISSIGTSITNAIVSLKNSIDTTVQSISGVAIQIGTDAISSIGTSITNAIVNLKNATDTISTNIGNISTQIGADTISSIGPSITNAIVNLKSAIDTIANKIGDVDISTIGQSITRAISNLDIFLQEHTQDIYNINNNIGDTDIEEIGNTIKGAIKNIFGDVAYLSTENTFKKYNNKNVYRTKGRVGIGVNDIGTVQSGATTQNINLTPQLISIPNIDRVLKIDFTFEKQVYSLDVGYYYAITKPSILKYNTKDWFGVLIDNLYGSDLVTNNKETGELSYEIEYTKNEEQ